jgi:hypothetical protein
MAGIFNNNILSRFIATIIEDVANTSSNYYVTLGKFTNWPDDTNPPTPNTSLQASFYNVNSNILYGKKIQPSDLAYIANKYVWTSGTVYAQFDHNDANIFSKQFYVLTSKNGVFKCLFNNYGAPSTVEPNRTQNSGDFVTADGYRWKYLYTITSTLAKKFSTTNYMPIVPNQSVANFAEGGGIHVIVPTNPGSGYISGNGSIVFSNSATSFQISNNGSSSITGAYNGSTMYIYGGSGQGVQSVISSYVVNTSGKFVTTNTNIPGTDSTSLFSITPTVQIVGDGINARALSSVDANTGAITSISMTKRGTGYSYANVSIVSNSYFGSGATAVATISPPGGHGSNVVSEMGCTTLGISVQTTSADNIPSWLQYRQIALIYNPMATANATPFQDADFNEMTNFGIISAQSLLSPGEVIKGFNSGATGTVAYMNTSSLYVIGDTLPFNPYETMTSLTSGKTIIISTINTRQLVPNSHQVLYYKNIQPISRSGIVSEGIKLYFNF